MAKAKNIPSLTGIRGAAALLVVLFHYPWKELLGISDAPLIIANGWRGVDLFFILSGFILMHTHGSDFVTLGRATLREFAVNRFLRVYPLHFVVLIIMAILVGLQPAYADWICSLPGQSDSFSVAGFFQTLTLTNRIGLVDLGAWNGPSWSLSCEAVGYAAFPLIAFALTRCRSRTACFCAAAFLLIGFSALVPAGIGRMVFCFPAGMALAHASSLTGSDRYCPAITGASIVAICCSLAANSLQRFSVFPFATLIYALSLSGGAIGRLLSSRVALFLGKISFSLYLTHLTLLNAIIWFGWHGTVNTSIPVVVIGSTLVILVLAAYVTYRLIEAPCHGLARRYLSTRGSRVRASIPVLPIRAARHSIRGQQAMAVVKSEIP